MLNFIWPIFLIISFTVAIFSGNIDKTNMAIFSSTEDAINLCIKLLGTICLWNGIMKIAIKTKIILILKKFLKPILKILFPKISEKDEAYTEISMNIVANIMGLRKCSNTYGFKGNEVFARKKYSKKFIK